MSNLWFNIRFGTYHLQLSNEWKVSFKYNPAHHKDNRSPDWKWFDIYCLFGEHLQ